MPDYENDHACEDADEQRHARAVHNADKIVAALLVRAEDVREALTPGVDIFLLRLAVRERGEVFRPLVALAVDGEYLLVTVGNYQRGDDDGDKNAQQYYHAHHREGVFHELSHTVPEEGTALAHDVLLALFLVAGFLEFFEVDLRAEDLLFWACCRNRKCLCCPFASDLLSQIFMRGSTTL